MTETKQNRGTLKVPHDVSIRFERYRLDKKAAAGRNVNQGEALAMLLEQAQATPSPERTIPDVLLPINRAGSILDLRRRLMTAKNEIENVLRALESEIGQSDRDAAEDNLTAAERELNAAEQVGPTRSSAGAGSKSRKRVG